MTGYTVQRLTKREMLQLTGASMAVAAITAHRAVAQEVTGAQLDRVLYPSAARPSGGQLEVRLNPAFWEIPDPDAVELAARVRVYDPESWYLENTRLAQRNDEKAEKFAADGNKITAGEYYLRAVGFWRSAITYMPKSDPRMLDTYRKLQASHANAWSSMPPPFERVEIPFEGYKYRGHFFAARGKPGERLPVVFNYGGADGILLNGSPDGNSGPFRARGMSYLDVDGPGHGAPLRFDNRYAPPDVERFGKAVIDYLVSRPDVDPKRIGFHGSSMGGYYAPRCASAEERIAAVAVWSGAYRLQQDIFDYYPPIQERLAWLIGADSLETARKRYADYNLVGRAKNIHCPILVGYGSGDRVMDPHGALDLYHAATGSPDRSLVDGVAHSDRDFDKRRYIVDWFAKRLVAGRAA